MERTKAKMVVLGDTNVGKSSIVNRLVSNQFADHGCNPTIGAAFSTHSVSLLDQRIVTFEIWDTAGQEYYRSLTPLYYRGAHVAIIVYDITSEKSFTSARSWVDELKVNSGPQVLIGLAGNKLDREVERRVSKTGASKFAQEHGFIFSEVSAKTGSNIVDFFKSLAEKVEVERPETDGGLFLDLKQKSEKKKSGCC